MYVSPLMSVTRQPSPDTIAGPSQLAPYPMYCWSWPAASGVSFNSSIVYPPSE